MPTLSLDSRLLLLAFVLMLLGGCAALMVRTPELDRSVKAVAVVSLMDERTRVNRIGLTVFNNQSVVVGQTGVLNGLAMDTVDPALRASRPDWLLKDARGDVAAMTAAQKSRGTSWTTRVSALQPDLAALAKKLDADLLFVVIDFSLENTPSWAAGAAGRARAPRASCGRQAERCGRRMCSSFAAIA